MMCVQGESFRSLCVYSERAVRTPAEATRLMRDGCHDAGPASPSMRQFEWSLSSVAGLRGAPRYEKGRMVVHAPSTAAQRECQRRADYYGLSWSNGRETRAWLHRPTRLDFSRLCALLRDPAVRQLELETCSVDMILRMDADDELSLITRCDDAKLMARLRLMGVARGTSLARRQAPERLARAFGACGADDELCVGVLGGNPLRAVSS